MTPRVLVTGINGYIAVHTAAVLLRAGFAVRGTLRSRTPPSLVDTLRRSLQPYHPSDSDSDRLELVEVPDIGAPRAFDRAVQDVQAIAHLASPVSMAETDPGPMMRAAVDGTTSLLRSALAVGDGLRSVVLMSTISAVFSTEKDAGHVFSEADWNDVAERQVRELGSATPGYAIYQASKTAGERAFWRFQDEETPLFNMVALCPAPVLGPPLYLPDPISRLSMRVKDIYDIFNGGEIPEFSPIRSTFVDVRDVAELVLRAVQRDLNQDQSGNGERYLMVGNPEPVSPQRMADVLRKKYPERKDLIRKGNPGETYPDITWKFDSGKAKGLLGRDWIGFEKSVLDSAEMFLSPKGT